MGRVDDPAVVGAFGGGSTVEPLEVFAEPSRELVVAVFGYEHEVGGHAGLSGIQELRPGEAAGSEAQVGAPVHERRALAAQFEGDGSQPASRRLRHQRADTPAARKQDVVETLADERLGRFRSSLDHLDEPRRQRGGHQFGELPRCAGRMLRWLDHHGVSGGNRCDSGSQAELQRVVPGSDDEHDADGGRLDPAPRRHNGERCADPAGTHPTPQMTPCMADLSQNQTGLGGPGFERGGPEIRPECVFPGVAVVPQDRRQRRERLASKPPGRGGAGRHKPPRPLQDCWQVVRHRGGEYTEPNGRRSDGG